MKANHNKWHLTNFKPLAVSNGSKILKWKQITTNWINLRVPRRCFQWFKDTKMKANHNLLPLMLLPLNAVSNGSKILKWKQITTTVIAYRFFHGCFQWFKDTKMKANHNCFLYSTVYPEAVSNGSKILKWKQITTPWRIYNSRQQLFPMVQRY